ncbi:GNAT family N-acetyltransferase [Actinoplanes solisilvae]|uniref:GNAT family N-acetyltransferase n=1 Tax=Actinoplanes solisilvae TaxID=2486853 RepID=UPI000FDACAE5|nr:GNAT family N-acetyltransferase [Actinoplanes solisilvae]
MPVLQRLNAGHAPAVLAFELANRAWFAASISDRGDDYFTEFPDRHNALLAEQRAGVCAFYVLVADDAVLGRFNLFDIGNHSATLGYRMAEHACGRGLATATVRDLCGLAATEYGLRRLRAAAADRNIASRRVLTKAGFVPTGPASPGGQPGTWFERNLTAAEWR